MSKCFFFIGIFCLLGSCASQQSTVLGGSEYLVEGKLAVLNQGKSQSANFRWRQDRERYDLELWGILGQGRTRFEGTDETLQVSRGNEVLASGHPTEVMLDHLGFSLPIKVMAAWLNGEPAGLVDQLERDDLGHITAFSEQGWRVEMSRYRDLVPGSGRLHPARIVASRAPQKVTVAIRRRLQ